jgi:hypothetical protein
MTHVIFVHGIATRGADYDRGFARINGTLRQRRPDVNLVACRWVGRRPATLVLHGSHLAATSGGDLPQAWNLIQIYDGGRPLVPAP